MRVAITETELRQKIIQTAMGPALSPGTKTIAHMLTITRLKPGTVNANGANWDGVDRAGNQAVTNAIAQAQNMYDLH